MKTKSIVLSLLLLLIIILGAWFLIAHHKPNKPSSVISAPLSSPTPSGNKAPPVGAASPVVNTLLNTKNLALVLPANFPSEGNANILSSSLISDSQNKTTTVLRTTTTSKPIPSALDSYRAYLGQAGWSITEDTTSTLVSVISATQGKQQIKIFAVFDDTGKYNTVTVKYTTTQE